MIEMSEDYIKLHERKIFSCIFNDSDFRLKRNEFCKFYRKSQVFNKMF